MRLLQFDPSLVPNGGLEIYSGIGTLVKNNRKDAAGRAFHNFCLLQAGLIEREETSQTNGKEEWTDDDDIDAAGNNRSEDDDAKKKEGVRWKHKKENKKKKKDKAQDPYKLLGLEDIRWMATASQIKKAYQKAALKHHPDKACAGVEDAAEKARIEEKFKYILDAFEMLSDPAKRREYDSTDAFDDSLPESCKEEDFFAVFGSAFRRQARWSERSPVPDLGDTGTEYPKVQQFYDFWYGFKSWREFPHEDEEDPECAECREHRRWIERENARLRARGKKEETKRIREFVDVAYAGDPRIKAHKQRLREEREQRRREKAEAAAARAKAEETAKAEAEAAEAARAAKEAADAEEQRKARQQDQRELRRQRKRLRDLCSSSGDGGGDLLDPGDVEDLCKELSRQQIEALCDGLEKVSGTEEKTTLLDSAMQDLHASRGERADQQQAAKAEAAAASWAKKKAELKGKIQQAREWDEEEVRMLDKALVKFPVGVPRRWEQITAYVRTRTQQEVIFMCKVRQGAHMSKAQQDWRAGRKGGIGANVAIGAEADDRGSAFTDVSVKMADEETPSTSQNGKAAGEAADGARGGEAKATVGDSGAGSGAGSGEWTKELELALIKAMKAFGKDVPDRWTKIAEQVHGKSALDCRKRFQEIKAKAQAASKPAS